MAACLLDQSNHTRACTNDPGEKIEKPCTYQQKRTAEITAGAGSLGILTLLKDSVGRPYSLSRLPSFATPARSHARHEHKMKPKPISHLGLNCFDYTPQYPIKMKHVIVVWRYDSFCADPWWRTPKDIPVTFRHTTFRQIFESKSRCFLGGYLPLDKTRKRRVGFLLY